MPPSKDTRRKRASHRRRTNPSENTDPSFNLAQAATQHRRRDMKTKPERAHTNPHQPAGQIRLPEPRYACDGEDCPAPGHVHQAGELSYHNLTIIPGFFCRTCLPKPLMFENPGDAPEHRTLEEMLAERNGDPGTGPEEKGPGAVALEDLLELAERAHGPESLLKGMRKLARRAREGGTCPR